MPSQEIPTSSKLEAMGLKPEEMLTQEQREKQVDDEVHEAKSETTPELNKLRTDFFEQMTPEESNLFAEALGSDFNFANFQELATDIVARQSAGDKLAAYLSKTYKQSKAQGEQAEAVFKKLNQKFSGFYEQQGQLIERQTKKLEQDKIVDKEEMLSAEITTMGKVHEVAQAEFVKNLESLGVGLQVDEISELSEEEIVDLVKEKKSHQLSEVDYLKLGHCVPIRGMTRSFQAKSKAVYP